MGIEWMQLFGSKLIVIQDQLCYVMALSQDPEIQTHFLLAPTEYDSFSLLQDCFLFGLNQKGLSLSYNLNIFNGKFFDDSLKSSSDQLFGISGGDVYQLQS